MPDIQPNEMFTKIIGAVLVGLAVAPPEIEVGGVGFDCFVPITSIVIFFVVRFGLPTLLFPVLHHFVIPNYKQEGERGITIQA